MLPFQTLRSGITGRLVRCGAVADTILSRHAYPDIVSGALGEAIGLTSMLGAALKGDGKLILQTRTDGPMRFLVVNFETSGRLRGYASYDADKLKMYGKGVSQGVLLGRGHLVMTIDPGSGQDRSQGIVGIERQSLRQVTESYFRQSEQLPTFIRVAVARIFVGGAKNGGWAWRVGGLMIQHLAVPGGAVPDEEKSGEAHDARLEGEGDENWNRARILAETVEDHELLDPMLAPERLLYRLFHEEGVKVFPPQPLNAECGCSRERFLEHLKNFGNAQLKDLAEPDGSMTATCEFCNKSYHFAADEIG